MWVLFGMLGLGVVVRKKWGWCEFVVIDWGFVGYLLLVVELVFGCYYNSCIDCVFCGGINLIGIY